MSEKKNSLLETINVCFQYMLTEKPEKNVFFKYLKDIIDPNILPHILHPTVKNIIDFYSHELDLWIQYDGQYWHGKNKTIEELKEKNTEHSNKIIQTKLRDEKQNKIISNLVRFWGDEVNKAIKSGQIEKMILDKIKDHKYKEEHCWQYDVRLNNLEDDIKNSGLSLEEISKLKLSDFKFEYVDKNDKNKCKDISNFIKRHEWLGKMPQRPTHRFIATYKGILAGVVVLTTPNEPSHILGKENINMEKLISRGACISWSPKNLASSLIMWAIRWMVRNTEFRLFTAYGDPEAKEIGTIYQACNFYYLGQKSGSKKLYFDPLNHNSGWFSERTFRKINKYKQYAKERGIDWQEDWEDGRTIKWDNMDPKIEIMLKNSSKSHKNRCLSREVPPKHKYCYILGRNKKETKKLLNIFNKLNKTKAYPKRNK